MGGEGGGREGGEQKKKGKRKKRGRERVGAAAKEEEGPRAKSGAACWPRESQAVHALALARRGAKRMLVGHYGANRSSMRNSRRHQTRPVA